MAEIDIYFIEDMIELLEVAGMYLRRGGSSPTILKSLTAAKDEFTILRRIELASNKKRERSEET